MQGEDANAKRNAIINYLIACRRSEERIIGHIGKSIETNHLK